MVNVLRFEYAVVVSRGWVTDWLRMRSKQGYCKKYPPPVISLGTQVTGQWTRASRSHLDNEDTRGPEGKS